MLYPMPRKTTPFYFATPRRIAAALALGSTMVDIMTRSERSERMSRIRSKDTKPERIVRTFLHGEGFRYRLHVKDMPGRPDLVLPKYRTAIFVDGCFWHGHVCQGGRVPATASSFWHAKILANQARDKRNHRTLRRRGWRVLRVWECQLYTQKGRDKALVNLVSKIQSSPARLKK